ncbi:Putative glycosyltransferase EpsH [Paraglaciecola mesophila]|uniref:Glycosyltransferase EpsH n=1 Tax=Paraglaciecola mesophila TaxID=197222 RepID=A0A857JQA5_9ALTE|nr:glycosyltransferase family 2 protein [Paraglaciecola mesophila]QHJ13582.1 Putative glycosyltransferase EpsH [Paraglaciecola mesophila]
MSFKVSVIVPVFNSELYLNRCFESLREQTLTDIEIIFVDDGSTDKSADILRGLVKADKRVKLITQSNKGTGTARNAGIRSAKGEYITFMDSDDTAHKEMLNSLFNKATFENDIVVCGHQEIKLNQTIKKHSFETNYNAKDYFSDIVSLDKPSAVWAKIYHRDLFLNPKCMFSERTRNNEDNATLLKLLYFSKSVTFIADAFYNWFRTEGSKSQSINVLRITESINVMGWRKNFLTENGAAKDYEKAFLKSVLRTITVRLNNIYKFTTGNESNRLLCHLYRTLYQSKLLNENTLKVIKQNFPSDYWSLLYRASEHSKMIDVNSFVKLFPKVDVDIAKYNSELGIDARIISLVKNIEKVGVLDLYIYGVGETWLMLEKYIPSTHCIKGFIDKKFEKSATKKSNEFTLNEAFSVMEDPCTIVVASFSQVEQITEQILMVAKDLNRTPRITCFFEAAPKLQGSVNG